MNHSRPFFSTDAAQLLCSSSLADRSAPRFQSELARPRVSAEVRERGWKLGCQGRSVPADLAAVWAWWASGRWNVINKSTWVTVSLRGCRVGDSVCVSPPVIQTLWASHYGRLLGEAVMMQTPNPPLYKHIWPHTHTHTHKKTAQFEGRRDNDSK